jgi:hypothetical protein
VPKICRILKWVCAFVVAAAIATLISPLPLGLWLIVFSAAISYLVGKSNDDWQLQMIAAGLIFGAVKWHYGG